jgi:hypothetical protein
MAPRALLRAAYISHETIAAVLAARHYLQSRDAHFELITGLGGTTTNPTTTRIVDTGQNPTPPAPSSPAGGRWRGVSDVADASSDPDGIRTRVTRMKTWCPRPG